MPKNDNKEKSKAVSLKYEGSGRKFSESELPEKSKELYRQLLHIYSSGFGRSKLALDNKIRSMMKKENLTPEEAIGKLSEEVEGLYPSSLEKNKAIIRSLIEAFNKHNLALLDDFIASDFVDHTLELRGLDSFKKFEASFIKAFPDYHETIEDITAEGDEVWVHFKVMGTHTGELDLLGITLAPTGKKITYTGIGIWRIVNGKVVERKSVRDMLVFLQQLGVIEPTEKAKKLFPEDVS